MFLSGVLVVAGCSIYAATKAYNRSNNDKPFIKSLYAEFFGRQMQNVQESDLNDSQIAKDASPPQVEEWIDQNFAISSASLALNVAGALIYAPLTLVGVTGLVYLVYPIWRQAYHDLVHRRRITRMVLEAIVLPGVLLTGYFVAAAVTYWILYFSLNLMAKAKGHTLTNLESVFEISSDRSVWIQSKSGEIEIPLKEVKNGDVVVIQAGEIIPVDGTIISGSASIDQHMLTGESQLAEKEVGDSVLATTIVLSGRICIKVEQAGEQTIAAQINQTLSEMTQFTKTLELRSVEMGDRAALSYLTVAGLATSLFGPTRGLAVLYSPVNDALWSGGPLGVLNYLNIALKSGILVKDGRALEVLCEVDTIAGPSCDSLDTMFTDQLIPY